MSVEMFVIASVVACLFVGTPIFILSNFLIKRKNIAFKFENQLASFQRDVSSLGSAVRILDQLSTKYFITLSESGYQEICAIYEVLHFSAEHCGHLMKAGDYDGAQELLKYLYIQRGSGPAPRSMGIAVGARSSYMENWGFRIKKLLTQVTANLEKNSSELKEICGTLERSRKGTSLMISEARLALVNL